MPRYYFDRKNGRRVVDAVGASCNDDMGARATAKFIAKKISIEKPSDQKRCIAVLNELGDEIDQIAIGTLYAEKLSIKSRRSSVEVAINAKSREHVMEEDLYSIAYLSRSNSKDNADLKKDSADILATSRLNNRTLGITGALLCSGHSFAQVLEGPAIAVEAIFAEIECDNRHTDIRVLFSKSIGKRSLYNWSMAFTGILETTPEITGYLSNPIDLDAEKTGEDIITLLKTLIERQETDPRSDAAGPA